VKVFSIIGWRKVTGEAARENESFAKTSLLRGLLVNLIISSRKKQEKKKRFYIRSHEQVFHPLSFVGSRKKSI
jgi:hypothetical protein